MCTGTGGLSTLPRVNTHRPVWEGRLIMSLEWPKKIHYFHLETDGLPVPYFLNRLILVDEYSQQWWHVLVCNLAITHHRCREYSYCDLKDHLLHSGQQQCIPCSLCNFIGQSSTHTSWLHWVHIADFFKQFSHVHPSTCPKHSGQTHISSCFPSSTRK